MTTVRKQVRRFLESEPTPIPARKSTLDAIEKIIATHARKRRATPALAHRAKRAKRASVVGGPKAHTTT